MSSTLKQLGAAIAIKAGLPVPVTLIGNTDRTAQAVLQAIKDGTHKDAFRDVDWSFLHQEHNFTTTGAEYYQLPSDFDRFVNNTIWDRTNGEIVIGPVAPDKWQLYVSGLSGLTGSRRICRLTGPDIKATSTSNPELVRRIQIYPDDSAEDPLPVNTAADPIEINLEYISSRYIANVSSIGRKYTWEWMTDDDYALFDDDIVEAAALWRLLRILGMSYADEREEYNALVLERGSSDGGAETLSLLQNDYMYGLNIPDTGYGS